MSCTTTIARQLDTPLLAMSNAASENYHVGAVLLDNPYLGFEVWGEELNKQGNRSRPFFVLNAQYCTCLKVTSTLRAHNISPHIIMLSISYCFFLHATD